MSRPLSFKKLNPFRRCWHRRPPIMSFARPRVIMGLQPRLLVSHRTASIRSAILAHRLLSTSTCSHAQHAQGPPNSNSHDGLSSGVTSRTRHTEPAVARYDAHGNELNPYAGGQSAIDKAVHLFFFTEIIRGATVPTEYQYSILMINRNVDCSGEFLPPAVHDHVSF